jgi:hypothetical protein
MNEERLLERSSILAVRLRFTAEPGQTHLNLGNERKAPLKRPNHDRIMAGQNHKAENAAKPNIRVCFVFMILPNHDSVEFQRF